MFGPIRKLLPIAWRLTTVCVVGWGSLAAAKQPLPDAAIPGQQPGVLLLRNGELISGKITLAGDRYDVQLPDGELRIKKSEVEMFGRNAGECFQAKLRAIDTTKVEDHLALVDWCLRQHLAAEAEAELQAATLVERSHPKIALLRRRLELSKQQPVAVAKPTAPAVSMPTADELDRMVRQMPRGSVETFTSTIQPMLLNHCSTASCHGPQSKSSLKLLRIPVGRVTSRRATQRNLYATLASINREEPNESPLLLEPTKQHGTTKAAIFTNRDAAQYKQIVDWVVRVSSYEAPTKTATVPTNVPATSTPLLQTVAEPAKSLEPPVDDEGIENESPAAGTTEPRAGQPNLFKPTPNAAPLRPKGPTKRVEAAAAFVPKDPFDPEIFNRQFQTNRAK